MAYGSSVYHPYVKSTFFVNINCEKRFLRIICNFADMNTALIYLDNAATTPVDPSVLEAMNQHHEVFGNPSSVHVQGRKARVLVEQARRTVAKIMQVAPAEVFFTSGGTEANNAILWGCALNLGYTHFITSMLEHPAVLKPLQYLRQFAGIQVHFVNTDTLGHIDPEHLEKLLKEHPGALVSLMHANNETGNLLPVNTVSHLCKKYQAAFHSDTVQTIGKYSMDLPHLGFDFAVASAHKFCGPKGVGFMAVPTGKFFKPFIAGGGQERNMRAGTENVPAIIGLAKALEIAHVRMAEDQVHIRSLKSACIRLLRERIQGVGFNGDVHGSSLHTILNVSLPLNMDADLLLPNLDMAGICVSSGSACASGSNKASHVLSAMEVDPSRPSVRISFGRQNTLAEVETLVDVLARHATPL